MGWSASAVRDQRDMVAAHFYEELSAEAAAMGVIIDHVELLTVDVDAPDALRKARNNSVLDQETAEGEARVGSVRVGLQRSILHQMQELLSDREHPLPPEAIAAIVRSQIRELGLTPALINELEEVLDETLPGSQVGHSHTHQYTRGHP